METDIILKGFQAAQTQHGVRYTNYVGDRDSSVYSALVASDPEWRYYTYHQTRVCQPCAKGFPGIFRTACKIKVSIQGEN